MERIVPCCLSDNCVRTAMGYCRIRWQQSTGTTPDTFQLDTESLAVATAGGRTAPTMGAGAAIACPLAAITIPDASPNGFSPIPIPPATIAFQPTFCGGVFGLESETTSQSWTCKFQHQIMTELITLL